MANAISPKPIRSFTGRYGFLSNFYPCKVEFEGAVYPSVEHAFQAAKTLDPDERIKFQSDVKPATAKAWGRKLALRPDWEEAKVGIMTQLVRDKFTRADAGQGEPRETASLKDMLLATQDRPLEEGNRHGDRFWGTVGGQGRNWLGRILMQVRDEIQAG